MSDWQTFDRAPKDGTTFLAYDAHDGGGIFMGVVACRWLEAEEDEPDEFPADWVSLRSEATYVIGINECAFSGLSGAKRDTSGTAGNAENYLELNGSI